MSLSKKENELATIAARAIEYLSRYNTADIITKELQNQLDDAIKGRADEEPDQEMGMSPQFADRMGIYHP